MNIYFIAIISILLFEYILSFIVRALNLKALSPQIPDEFEDIIDKERYEKSQSYTLENSKFSYITSTFTLLVNLLFIFGGFYNVVDQFVRNMGYGNTITGLLFFGLLFILTDIINVPFNLYRTFVIEERFGFNKTNFSTFLLDKIKGYFLLVIIGGPFLSLILFFFEHYNTNAWIYAWIVFVIFSLIMQPIFNIFIAPMFNKFTSLEEGPLLYKIKDYLNKVKFPVKKLEVIDGSRRSSHSNAYFSGMGKNKRIALFDTLVNQMDDDEIVSVIAHEVGHYKLKHIHMNIIVSSIQSGIMLFILSIFIMNENLFNVFKMDELSIYASFLFFSILYTPISMFMGFLFSYISRKNEFSADEFSAKTTNSPKSLITGLKKMSKENLSNLTPHWLHVMLNYSHPPVIDRINALKVFIK